MDSGRAATDAATATARAKLCGTQVEVGSARSETGQVFVHPDGTATSIEYATPVRVHRPDGSWVDPDPSLVPNPDGTFSPRAATVDVAFSGGGSGPLATVRRAGGSVAVSWPRALPKPVVNGATATYGGVLPGVDLVVTAEVTGFREILVVTSAAALANPLLRRLAFGAAATGLRLEQDGDGLRARDTAGRVVLASSAPVMWDSASAPPEVAAAEGTRATSDVTGPGAGAHVAQLPLALGNGQLVVTPDVPLLDDRTTRLPLYIDPSIGYTSWTMINSRFNTQSYWNFDKKDCPTGYSTECAKVGYTDSGQTMIYRSLFEFSAGSYQGRHILGAKMTIDLIHSWECYNTSTWLVLSNSALGSGTNWSNNSGTWNGSATASVSNQTCHDTRVGSEFTGGALTSTIQSAAGGWVRTTWGLRAAGEGDHHGWKKFDAKTAKLIVDFNSYPTMGARGTSPATACVAGSGTPAANLPLLNSRTPALQAVVNDPDVENDLKGSFVWQQWNGSAWVGSGSATDAIARSNGGTSSVTPTLVNDGIYRWQAQVLDPWTYGGGSGTDTSAWSSWCEFQVDATPPPLPAVSSVEYPGGCAPCGGVGATGTSTLSAGAPDVTGYWWGFSDPPSTFVAAPAPGAAVTIAWTPTVGGPKTLFVQSRDAAGNSSAVRRDYQFTVDTPKTEVGRWSLNESGGTALADGTGNGHGATLNAGTLGAPGRIVGGDSAVRFNGSGTEWAATSGPVLNTSNSFSVAAWVRLSDSTAFRTAVTQDGLHSSGFQPQYAHACNCWEFALPNADTLNPGQTVTAAPGPPTLNVWTHLVGVFDAAAHTAKLYVNGALVATAPAPAVPWNAVGALTIGRSKWNDGNSDFWAGDIADVRVWQRVLFDSEVRTMVDPTATGPVGLWHFNEVDSSFALDSSQYLHDLTLNGGASIPPSGAGHDGTGLLLMDGTGWAETDGPAIHTDQSFTVSAWVRMDETTLPTGARTAVAQSGTWISGFFLGYRPLAGVPRWDFGLKDIDSDDGPWTNAASANPVTTADLGKWVHLRGVYDASTRGISLYVNGVLVGSATRPLAGWDATGSFTVGSALWSPAGGQPARVDFWKGAIDEARVDAGVVPPAAGDWRFDSCTGTPVQCADASQGAHPVTLSASGATWTPSGYSGSGLSLNGGAAQTAGPVLNTTQSFTVGAWVQLNTTPTTAYVAVSQSGAQKSNFELQYQKETGQYCFSLYDRDSGGAGRFSACAGGPPTMGAWTHLAGVYDAVAGRMSLYVNGALASSTSFTAPWNATGPLAIGRGWHNGAAAAYWPGLIDEVRVYQGVVGDPSTLM